MPKNLYPLGFVILRRVKPQAVWISSGANTITLTRVLVPVLPGWETVACQVSAPSQAERFSHRCQVVQTPRGARASTEPSRDPSADPFVPCS